jgi:hypothetical protein
MYENSWMMYELNEGEISLTFIPRNLSFSILLTSIFIRCYYDPIKDEVTPFIN